MSKKIYSISYELFEGLKLIEFTTLCFYVGSNEPSYKTASYIIGAIFGVISIMINYTFLKKVCTKKSYLVYKKDTHEWIFSFSGIILVLIVFLGKMLDSQNDFQFQLWKILIILSSINLLLLFLNRFLGTEKEDEALDALSETNN